MRSGFSFDHENKPNKPAGNPAIGRYLNLCIKSTTYMVEAAGIEFNSCSVDFIDEFVCAF